jgi:hypothetical protein
MKPQIDWQTIFIAIVPFVIEGRAKEEEARLLRELSVCQLQDPSGRKGFEVLAKLSALYFAGGKIKAGNLLIKSILAKTEGAYSGHHLEASRALCALAEVFLAKKQYHRIGPLVMHTNLNLHTHLSRKRTPSRLSTLLAESQSIFSREASPTC